MKSQEEKLINWSELSRMLTGGNRQTIRPNRENEPHKAFITRLKSVIKKEIDNYLK